MSAAIEVDAIVKTFGDTRALDGVTFNVDAGEVLGLLGPNGAGKTTTINVLATLLRPDSGSARVAGLDVVDDAERVRQHIALTGQFAALDEVLTGRENLRLFGRLRGLDRGAARSKSDELLERFSLSDAGDRPVSTYSGGMRRRLDLAASLVVPASVLFLDEPTTGLDPRSRTELWDVVRDLRRDGLTIVLTTQYLEEADQLAERIVVIDTGDVVASGTPDELKAMTGGHSVVVIPLDPADGPTLGNALSPVGDTNVDERTGAVTLLDTAAPQLPEVVRIVDSTQVEISDLSLRRPTLDEVFLQLTDHSSVGVHS
ncbi:MAG: ATP-binding cassette domain-containing protein [Actinomycetota bacterium]